MPNLNQRATRASDTDDWNSDEPDAVQTGAFLYVIEREKESAILAAIRAAHGGDIDLRPATARFLRFPDSPRFARSEVRQVSSPEPARVPAEELTRREIDVLRLLAHGNTNRQAADLLGLSIRTVEGHRANLIAKLGLTGRVEMVRYAAATGLL